MEVKTLRVTVLCENTSVNERLSAEHGLSLYIEVNGYKVLFDMGQTALFAANASKLGIDLASVDIAVLSHGHYDHGGGLKDFLGINRQAKVYITAKAFGDYYNGTEKYIGLDKTLCNHPRLTKASDGQRIGIGLTLYQAQHIDRSIIIGGNELKEKTAVGFIPDEFEHEQYLLIEENGRHILISGCSHRGILNIVKHFRPDVLIGGFHFSKLPPDGQLEAAAHELSSYSTEYHTCHCTGTAQYEYMKNHKKSLWYLSTGASLEI